MVNSLSLAALASRLHSRYKPQLEADRYIEALTIRQDIDYFVLIEPGLGYLVQALYKVRPGCKAVILHADSIFREISGLDTPVWYPDSGITVQEFLENEIPDIASVQIIEWKPSFPVFGQTCLDLVRESVEFIKRAAASRRTAAAFGRRWVHNFFRNLTFLYNTVWYRPMDMPLVITGSGPSLETVLPQIHACRSGIFVIAASSSISALAAAGIIPDMVISTDGGAWALMHLYACFRIPAAAPMLAFAMCAALPSQCTTIPMLPINDGSLWQNMALNAAGIPSVLVPSRGTVTASALELAMHLSSGDIFLAGMDLALADIQSHARPYGFDHFFSSRASRFLPVYSQLFMRACDIQAGGSHAVYASWFKTHCASWPKRIFFLGSKHPVLTLPGKSLSDARETVSAENFKTVTVESSPRKRCRLASEALIAALHNEQYAGVLHSELSPLLFPSRSDVPAGEIAQLITQLAHWDESHG